MNLTEVYSEIEKFDWRSFAEKWCELYDEMKPQIEIQLQIERSVKTAKDRIDEQVRIGTEKQDARIREYNAARRYDDIMRGIADWYLGDDYIYNNPSTLRQKYSWEL